MGSLALVSFARQLRMMCFSKLGSHLAGFASLEAVVHVPISPPRVDSSKGPHRLNRAHWPTKENRQQMYSLIFLDHGQNGLGWPQIGPG